MTDVLRCQPGALLGHRVENLCRRRLEGPGPERRCHVALDRVCDCVGDGRVVGVYVERGGNGGVCGVGVGHPVSQGRAQPSSGASVHGHDQDGTIPTLSVPGQPDKPLQVLHLALVGDGLVLPKHPL